MPRPSKGARLSLYKAKGRNAMWTIRDGQRTIGTGCAEGERGEAERKLAEYIVSKHDPRAGRCGGDPNKIKVADALSVYMEEKIATSARPKAGIAMIENLGEFFGERTIGELNGSLQRAYAAQRGSQSAARRELETMAAAINHHIRDMVGGVQTLFRPVLPDAAPARERWLTVNEAARLVLAAWRKREVRDGKETGRYTSRHIARFILVALYTGTRAGAICSAALIPTIGRGHINLETGQFRRLAYGKKQSNKRQPTVDLHPKLLGHIRRWQRLGISTTAVVEHQGTPVQRVSKGWDKVVEKAGLASDIKELKVVPHTMRHTAISWMLRNGVAIDKVSDYCGVSIQIIKKVYGHHIPGGFDSVIASHRSGRTSATDTQQKRMR
ncbi:tyrosine-type recombinase/integrase [Bradyrhizobium sp. GCM10023182]|uniref:Tyrosine-type recombinase/integrase n=1 Tax=Bradyrhizobium zhengyangense TaxID=2911009 RepID=A0ABS9M2T9_9BRAD|nr:tyrosine-type recombinase/integrase [Bradyrhizobium zhengyangense]MCG2673343.1 tyrosine-type recombinase/integrase [Bradyrhizobium zhengyangense]